MPPPVALVADADVEAEVIVSLQIVDNLLGEVVHVDHDALIARGLELLDDMPQQRLPPYPDECLGHRIGQRFQPRSEASSEYHGLFHPAKVRKFDRKNKKSKKYLEVIKKNTIFAS